MADNEPAAPVDPGAAATPTPPQDEWGAANDAFALSKSDPLKKEGDKDADKDKPAGVPPEGAPKPDDKKPTPAEGDKPADKDKPDGAEGEDKDKPGEGEPQPPEPPDDPEARAYRQRQRQLAEDEAAIKTDIRKQLFSDVQTELTDADGDPIRSIEDVQKLTNPNTGKPFTEEEAGAWLLAAKKHLNERNEEVEKKIDGIAQANLDLRDWSDAVRTKYGEFIKANPGIWQPIWAEYERTLEKDEKSELITRAPVNLERFVDVALAPHIKLVETTQQQAEQEQKDKVEKDKKQVRADRSDIYAGGKSGTPDKDDEEWGQAAKEYYEGK